jgi:polyisoprenoid-binding protein YceI
LEPPRFGSHRERIADKNTGYANAGAAPEGALMSVQETVVRYQIDPAMSRLTIKVLATGMFSAIGHNPTIAVRDYSGEAGFVPGTLDEAYIRFTARPDTFEVTDDLGQSDKNEIEQRMKQDVLETRRYGEIAFESSSITPAQMGENQYAVNMTGNLTLHGITRSQSIRCQVSLSDDTVRGFGEFDLRQTDFGIKLASVAGGTLKVKDELKCSFDIVARKQA